MHLQLAVLYSFWCAVDPLRQQAYIDSMSILHNHLAWKLRKATGGTSPATCEISLVLTPVEYQTCKEEHVGSFFCQCELASCWSQGSPQWRDSQDCIVPAFGGKIWGNLWMEKGTLGLRPGEATLEDLLREVKADSSPWRPQVISGERLLDHMLANRQLSPGYDCPASSVRRSLKSSEDVER